MKRKILSMFIVSTMIFALVGCGNKKEVIIPEEEPSLEEEEVIEVTPEVVEILEDVIEPEDNKISENKIYESDITYEIDLNNDGIEESILYSIEPDPEYEDDMVGKLYINDIDCSDIINLYNPLATYHIVDIDESDDYYEIVLSTYGLSDDLESEFLRFDGESLILLGNTEGIIGEGIPFDQSVQSIRLLHNGQMEIYTRTDIIETTFIPVLYEVVDNEIVKVDENRLYVFETPREGLIKTTIPLTVHTQIDSEDTVTLDEGIEFDTYRTDNKEWVNVDIDNTEYWLHVVDGVLVDEDNIFIWEALENLFMAD